MALFEAGQTAVLLRNLLEKLGAAQLKATPLHEDNEACMLMANSAGHTRRSRHIAIRYHYTRELIEEKIIQLVRIDGRLLKGSWLTHGLTKNLPRERLSDRAAECPYGLTPQKKKGSRLADSHGVDARSSSGDAASCELAASHVQVAVLGLGKLLTPRSLKISLQKDGRSGSASGRVLRMRTLAGRWLRAAGENSMLGKCSEERFALKSAC
ncbi:unnamed protein product [Phaeothamnion confervicola]